MQITNITVDPQNDMVIIHLSDGTEVKMRSAHAISWGTDLIKSGAVCEDRDRENPAPAPKPARRPTKIPESWYPQS